MAKPSTNDFHQHKKHSDCMTHNIHAPYLFATDRGRALRCVCCGRIQIEFAERTLLLDRSGFEKLDRKIREVSLPDQEKGLWLKATTEAGSVSLSLRPEDLAALARLLSGARAMLELQNRLCATAAGRHSDVFPKPERA
jgi:hypothetical protein